MTVNKIILCCFLINLFLSNCLALFGLRVHSTYNPNLTSVVFIQSNIIQSKLLPYNCTGIIISDTLVLTAAHCLKQLIKNPQKAKAFVYLQVKNKNDLENATKLTVVDFRMPENVEEFYRKNDSIYEKPHDNIVLMKVAPTINLTEMHITPVTLATFQNYRTGITIAGYGNHKSHHQNGNLTWKFVGRSRIGCPKNKYFHSNTICFKNHQFVVSTSLAGDEGGPAFDEKFEFIGVLTLIYNNISYYARVFNKLEFLKTAAQELNGSL